MVDELTPRARVLLDAVEREAEARRRALAAPTDTGADRTDRTGRTDVHVNAVLLAALELGVAGLERSEVADRLRSEQGISAPDPLLDAVFGTGSPPRARLRRTTGA